MPFNPKRREILESVRDETLGSGVSVQQAKKPKFQMKIPNEMTGEKPVAIKIWRKFVMMKCVKGGLARSGVREIRVIVRCFKFGLGL